MQMLIKLQLDVSLAVEAGDGGGPSNMRVVSLCTGFVAWL